MTTQRLKLMSGCTLSVFLTCALLTFFSNKPNVSAQESVSRVVVSGEEVPSAYGAPPAFSRSRFAPLTNAYVLPPWGFFFGTIYEGDAFRHGPPDHNFTQEVEMGLPYRFGVAAEVAAEEFNGEGQAKSISLEGRYALADWNKIPLNPTIFAEYKFGVGHVLKEEGGGEEEDMGGDEGGGEFRLQRLMRQNHHHHHVGRPQDEEPGEEEGEEGRPEQPDAYEFRLLLSQDFGEKVEWALNGFFEQEVEGDRGREWGFAQSATMPIILPNERLKAGIEMQYRNFTDKDTRDDPSHSFVIGPTVAWKPSRNTRFDLSPLFGVTDDSPRVQVFAIFSFVFGGEGQEAEAPASTRNR